MVKNYMALITGLIGLASGWIRRHNFVDSKRSHLEYSSQITIIKFILLD